jgi:hypothetical protein
MTPATPKSTWTPIWTVRYDGSRLDAFEVCDTGHALLVRTPGATTYGRWDRESYDLKFGATPEDAIAKFHAHALREVELATEELHAAEALFARALALTPDTETTH